MFSLPSFAKINWTLRVLGKRADGFHELFTVFQTVSLHDTLEFSSSDVLTLTCDDRNLATGDSNLIMQAARALKQRFPKTGGGNIHLRKTIPFPGGLGGGSSNAAVTLIGLARLWQLDIVGDLQAVAAELGSDVPFFLQGGTAAGAGRGEIVDPTGDGDARYMLLVTPAVKVSTHEAFAALRVGASLTSDALERSLTVCRNEARSLDPLHSELINDLERTVFSAYPEVARVKETLLGLGAVNAAMSGSGATVFAVFDKQETRQAALAALDEESSWAKFAVSTISRSEYASALGI